MYGRKARLLNDTEASTAAPPLPPAACCCLPLPLSDEERKHLFTLPTAHGWAGGTLAPERSGTNRTASNTLTVPLPKKPRWVDLTEEDVDVLWLYGPNTRYSELLKQAPLSAPTADVPILAVLTSELVTTGALPAILPSCGPTPTRASECALCAESPPQTAVG